MTTARQIITGALSYRLNRLSPGEAVDADLGAWCLTALNNAVLDAWNASTSFLYRQILTPGVCNGTYGTLGTTWPGLTSGNEILGATVSYSAGMDIPLEAITMEQYQLIPQKATASIPQWYCPDGDGLVYLWPAAAGQTVTLLTAQQFAQFADLDTDYSMPNGYLSAMTDILAETIAPVLVGGVPPAVASAASAARERIAAAALTPAMINTGPSRTGNILSGWR